MQQENDSRKSLTLLLGPVAEKEENDEKEEVDSSKSLLDQLKKAHDQSTFDLLHFDFLTTEKTQWLIEKLPAISQLTVSVRKSDSFVVPQLTLLITAWSPRLTDLTIYLNLQEETNPVTSSRLHALLLAINFYCTWLRRLRVQLNGQFRLFQASSTSRLEMSILGQLESFSLSSDDSIACLLSTIKRWAVKNERLLTIEVGCQLREKSIFEEFLKLPTTFTRKFRRLGGQQLVMLANDEPVFEAFVNAFSGLVELRLRLNPVADFKDKKEKDNSSEETHLLDTTFRRLAKLNRLQTLELIVPSITNFKWRSLLVDGAPLQLPSVTSLTLTTVTNSHYDLSFFAVHRIFPKLQHFTLAIDESISSYPSLHFHCHRCQWWEEVLMEQSASAFDRCTGKAFRCLKRCLHLKTARLNLSSILPSDFYQQLWFPGKMQEVLEKKEIKNED